MKNTLLTIAKFGVSAGILGYLFHQASQHDQFQVLAVSEKHYGWLLLALGCGLGASLVAFFRWFLFVRALGLPFRYRDAVRLGFLGHLLNLMSVGVLGGDTLRSLFLSRQMKGHAAEAIASVIFDRAIGMLAMFTMACIAYLLTDFSSGALLHAQANQAFHFICRIATAATLAGYIGLSTIYFVPHFRRSKIYAVVSRLPKIGDLFQRFVAVALAYRQRSQVVIIGLLLSLLINILFAATLFLIAAGISDQHPTFGQHLVISPIAMLANAIPLPGGLGGMEFAVNFQYQALSSDRMPSEYGFVVALGFRLILLVAAGIGVIYYFAGKKELQQLSQQPSSLQQALE